MKRFFTQTFGVVGAIIEKDGKFLLAREAWRKGPDFGKWNQPAGWLEVGEDPIEAIKREVEEEAGYKFTPTHILGIYSLVRSDIAEALGGTPHALKIIFIGRISEDRNNHLHDDISETKWFSPEEIEEMRIDTLRDLDIKNEVRDYLAGKKYPLSLLRHTLQARG